MLKRVTDNRFKLPRPPVQARTTKLIESMHQIPRPRIAHTRTTSSSCVQRPANEVVIKHKADPNSFSSSSLLTIHQLWEVATADEKLVVDRVRKRLLSNPTADLQPEKKTIRLQNQRVQTSDSSNEYKPKTPIEFLATSQLDVHASATSTKPAVVVGKNSEGTSVTPYVLQDELTKSFSIKLDESNLKGEMKEHQAAEYLWPNEQPINATGNYDQHHRRRQQSKQISSSGRRRSIRIQKNQSNTVKTSPPTVPTRTLVQVQTSDSSSVAVSKSWQKRSQVPLPNVYRNIVMDMELFERPPGLHRRQLELAPDDRKSFFEFSQPLIIGPDENKKYLKKVPMLCALKVWVIRDGKSGSMKVPAIINPTSPYSTCTLDVTKIQEVVSYPVSFTEPRYWVDSCKKTNANLRNSLKVKHYEYNARSEVQVIFHENQEQIVTSVFPVWVTVNCRDRPPNHLMLGRDFLRRYVPMIDYYRNQLTMKTLSTQGIVLPFEYIQSAKEEVERRFENSSSIPESSPERCSIERENQTNYFKSIFPKNDVLWSVNVK